MADKKPETTTILVSIETRERLGRLGTVDDDIDSVIVSLLDEHDDKKAKK